MGGGENADLQLPQEPKFSHYPLPAPTPPLHVMEPNNQDMTETWTPEPFQKWRVPEAGR